MIYLINATRRHLYPRPKREGSNVALPRNIRAIYYFPESVLTEIELVEWCKDIVQHDYNIFSDYGHSLIYTNSSIVITAFRALIKERALPNDQFIVKFYYSDDGERRLCERIVFDSDGRLEYWRRDFVGVYRSLLARIL